MVPTRFLAAFIVCATLTTGVCAAAASTIPSAFARAPVASDQLPASFKGIPGEASPQDSRRVATLRGTKRAWSVYIFKQAMTNRQTLKKRPNICVFVFTHGQGGPGGGGGCSPSESFFGPGRQVSASMGRVLAGVASDEVARVTVIGSHGVVHPVVLSPDHGFIFNCRAYNGCACVVSRLQAFDHSGRRIANQDLSAPNCRRR